MGEGLHDLPPSIEASGFRFRREKIVALSRGLRKPGAASPVLASPMGADSNRVLGWLREMDSLRQVIGAAA
jgi:hypothetical protein